MIRTFVRYAVAIGVTVAAAGISAAQGSPPSTAPRATVAAARVSKETASATAVKQVPGGHVQAISVGMVAGKLAYTAFVTESGKTGRTTVVVDATTGAVLSKRP